LTVKFLAKFLLLSYKKYYYQRLCLSNLYYSDDENNKLVNLQLIDEIFGNNHELTMLRFIAVLALGGIIMLTGIGADSQGKIFPFEKEEFILDNGLKIIVIPTPTEGIISYYSVVRTGSRDEWEEGYSGFAHFFEHMMFRGTKKYPGHIYDSLIVSMGADANAYTTDDYTCYHITTTKDNLEKVIELESDRFQNLSYEEDPFKTESGAVYGEYRKGKTDPFFVAYEKLMETAFDKHTYKHTTIGFEKDIAAMPTMYDYSISFFKRYYRPENVVIMITGDVKRKQVEKWIKSYYGSWQKGYVMPNITPEPEQTAPREAQVKYPGKTLPILAVAYKSLRYQPDNLDFISSIIIGDLLFGETSEIYKKLVINEQVAQTLEPDFGENRDPNLNMIFLLIKKEKDVNYVRDEVFATIEKYKNTQIDDKKLNDLKKRLKYSYLMNLDTPGKVAGGLAREIAITGGIEAVDKYFATLDRVSVADVQTSLNKLFTAERRTTITLLGSK